jgi:RNA polymerase sigma-70 factor (ECF subfamily)
MTMPDDTFPTPELLARLAAGDRAAFAVVVETWQRPLAGFLGRMGLPTARVEELVQDAFVRVWLNIGQYRPAQARFSTWLYTIARRLALNELDRAAHRHEQAAPAGADPDDALGLDAACPEPGPPGQLARRRRQALLQAALRRLTPEDRSVLALAYVQELSLADIARIEDCSAAAVRTRLWRARQRLREALGPDLEDHHEA